MEDNVCPRYALMSKSSHHPPPDARLKIEFGMKIDSNTIGFVDNVDGKVTVDINPSLILSANAVDARTKDYDIDIV